MNKELSKKDFQSDNEVRWCPGCGDYAILSTVQKTLADLGFNRDETVFVSGIGCAARFPYYMNTYGMHTIHGRAPAIATGIKLSNPRLHVFLVTGDGDGLSIGANHLMHLFRRNISITVLMFNNQIYGLTKGQYSPTSKLGHKAKSTPFGALEEPINPISFAIQAGATFIARSIDNDAEHLSQMLKAAIAHKGTSFIEILQNCVVFNEGAFEHLREKSRREQTILMLKDKEPLLFDSGHKGLRMNNTTYALEVVDSNTENKDDILVHDPKNSGLKPYALAMLKAPCCVGIFQSINRPTYEELKSQQDDEIKKNTKLKDLKTLLEGSNTWKI